LLQVFPSEFARATTADPRVDFKRLFAIAFLAFLPVTNSFGNHPVSVRSLSFINSHIFLLEYR
jgi:hypothetical protein